VVACAHIDDTPGPALTGAKISVGPPYFNSTFVPLMLPLLLAIPVGPYLAWKRGDVAGAMQRLFVAVAGGEEVWRRATGLPRAAYGTTLAHAGVGLLVLGIVATTAWQSERVVTLKVGEQLEIAGYELTFRGVVPNQGPNYQEQVGLMAVTRGGSPVTELEPAKRIYDAPRQATTEAGIYAAWTGDLYVVLGDAMQDGSGWVVRAYFNPLVRLIWIGCLVMALGGVCSLSDRRLRVGAPRRARRPLPAPAE
jgi:cytochrome c-type biogenesis protein CcmF